MASHQDPDAGDRPTLRLKPQPPKPAKPSRPPAAPRQAAPPASRGKPPAKPRPPRPAPAAEPGIRLAKRLAEQLDCSRREAELYIEAGAVEVDGVGVQDLGHRVLPDQTVSVRAGARPEPVAPVTLLLHKPAGHTVGEARRGTPGIAALLTREHLVTTGAPVPVLVLERHFRHQQPLLVLPIAASGLTVLTQDMRVARKLTEEALYIEQECLVEVRGEISEQALRRLCDGTAITGRKLPAIKVSRQSEQRLRFALKGIFPEEIEAMCAGVDLQVTALRRQRIGRISLAGLGEGQWRYALPWERF